MCFSKSQNWVLQFAKCKDQNSQRKGEKINRKNAIGKRQSSGTQIAVKQDQGTKS
jgi:hypothetical protein